MPRVFLLAYFLHFFGILAWISWCNGRVYMVHRQGLFWYVAGIIGMDGYTGCTGRIQVLERYHGHTITIDGRIGTPEV